MARHRDAIGYLLELRDFRRESWLSKACDLAIAADTVDFSDDEIRLVLDLFMSRSEYAGTAVTPAPLPAGSAARPSAFLKRVGGFRNFKRLGTSLELVLEKRVTLVFGRNGSGKSSICQALKTLADPKEPDGPLKNVRHQFPGDPSFEYTFDGGAAATWHDGSGFGGEADKIRYFDSTVALTHATSPMDPGRSVEVTPFRLEVFEFVRSLVVSVQEAATRAIDGERTTLSHDLQTFVTGLGAPAGSDAEPFVSLLALDAREMKARVESLPELSESHSAKLTDLESEESRLVEAGSASGIRELRARLGLLQRFKQVLDGFVLTCDRINPAVRVEQESDRNSKQSALRELNAKCFPEGVSADHIESLIQAAAAVCPFDAAAEGVGLCPLCHRHHDAESAKLFVAYHLYLTSSLREEVRELELALRDARAEVGKLRTQDHQDFSLLDEHLPDGQPENTLQCMKIVVEALPQDDESFSAMNAADFGRYEEVRALALVVAGEVDKCREAIEAGEKGGKELAAKLEDVRAALRTMRLERVLGENRDDASALIGRCEQYSSRASRVSRYDFATLLRLMTNKGKDAHAELVLSEFESRLNSEYRRLSGSTMAQLGVTLRPAATQQNVMVHPEVGGSGVHRVLSEGEQKVHALAAFLCEAGMEPHRVLVFDDPVNSFDYNYISNFCERLRDLVRDQPSTQVLVLTHNWDFFVNLQQTLNRSGLNAHLAVCVLEGCDLVREYREDIDSLVDEIWGHLGETGDPSEPAKTSAAGLMRRLIETVVNKHAFAGQRHQYKQKSQSASDFTQFTKLVPLLDAEAVRMRDLYADLSPPEHDDPRNFYTSRTGDQFRTWLSEILGIKSAIEGRRPT